MNIIMKNQNYEAIFELFDNNDINNFDINIIKNILYSYENKKRLIPYYEKLFNKYKNDEAFITLGMRLYLDINDVETSYKLLKYINKPKKRNILPIYNYYCSTNNKLAFTFYKNNLHNKFLINENEYIHLIKLYSNDYEKLDFIFNDMKNNILEISTKFKNLLLEKNKYSKLIKLDKQNKCLHCNDIMKLNDLSIKDKLNLSNNIKFNYFKKYSKELKKFEDFLQNKKIDIFIDAGNIMFYQERKITFNSFKKIDLIFKKLKKNNNVLIIIHQRHYNNLKKIELNKTQIKIIKDMYKSWNIYQTPYHLNDDWYFIYGSLLNDKSFIVTNDKLRDHQFKISEKTNINNTLSKFIDKFVIRYDFINKIYNNNNINIIFPNTFSTEIQKINYWHFPYNNKWLCYEV